MGVTTRERVVAESARGDLALRYRAVRAATEHLARALSPEDCMVQSMPDASPTKWHLAHTAWFFETFVLSAAEPSYRSPHPAYAELFNSYYRAVGPQYARPHRGLLSRPSLEEVMAYRRRVDEHVLVLLERGCSSALHRVVETGVHHEQQHQELILTDIKHGLSLNPLAPAYSDAGPPERPSPPLSWLAFSPGLRCLGHPGGAFCFDNEEPLHDVYVGPFEIASRCVTVAEYRAFMDDGGYERPELWLSDGFSTAKSEGWYAPLYWSERDGAWTAFTLGGRRALADSEPICHVSFYEADAYARWSSARLPTEAEWETAAHAATTEGTFLESGSLHPVAAPEGEGMVQALGDVWEWTASAYAPYPGYAPPPGALGEYNGKFMCNQMVLRGGSCVSARAHIRPTYRNFFYPAQRWQFSGIRLARDIRGG